MPAALRSELAPYERRVWRLVEGQHLVSTRKLVDSNAEQRLLEDLIEATKPVVPEDCRGLDYLLSTPFRYRPGARGSRFRRAGATLGVFYAAEEPQTAVAEMAFYRLLFFAESPATPWPVNPSEYTGFSTSVRTGRALDLTLPPLNADRTAWRDPIDTTRCQALAEAAREAGAEVLRYESVRDPKARACAAVLKCSAFAEPYPLDYQTWRIGVGAGGAFALREFPRAEIDFDRTTFAADPRIADMRWER
ncbi:RES family NAD+ phosphorylase [Roseiarcus sp.]|uniref:RES family NAD+ phosphorylase n=1 Tax=Roseiarcus sp. TaxID=1969460 RepID=UPI003F9516D0